MQNSTLVIIGGNAAGMSAARKAHRNNPNMKIIVLEKSSVVSYGACGIPYYIAGDVKNKEDLIAVQLSEFLKGGIDVKLNHEVVSIDARQRIVNFRKLPAQEIENVHYDQLVLSPGAHSIIPKIEGIELNGVFTIRSLDEAEQLKNELQSGKHKQAAVIGGGYIGLEMAEALVRNGVNVTVIEQKPQVLPGMDADMAELVVNELQKHGCKVFTGREVKRILGNDRVNGVKLDSGETLDVSLVVVSVGVRPNTKLAQMAGIQLGKSGAISVDAHMRTNIFRIFAAGDCVEVKNAITNKYEYIPLGNVANKQGRVAGDNASGGRSTMPLVVGNAIVKVFDLEVGRAGINSEYAERLNFNVKSVKIKANSRANYMPNNKKITIKLIFDVNGGRLRGAQLVGAKGADKRLQVLAAALQQKMSVMKLAELDLSYAPPYSPVWDPVLIAANQAAKLVRG